MKCHVFNVIMKANSNKKSNFWHEIEMEFMVLNVRKELTQKINWKRHLCLKSE